MYRQIFNLRFFMILISIGMMPVQAAQPKKRRRVRTEQQAAQPAQAAQISAAQTNVVVTQPATAPVATTVTVQPTAAVPVPSPAPAETSTAATPAVAPVPAPAPTEAPPASVAPAPAATPTEASPATPQAAPAVTTPSPTPDAAAVPTPTPASADATMPTPAALPTPVQDATAGQAPAPTPPPASQPAAPQPAPVVVPPTVPLQPQQTAKTAEEESRGISTVDQKKPYGNWLFKRIWWQKAEAQYEKIKSRVDVLMEMRISFFNKRTEWDKTIFGPFYLEAGMGSGILEELIANLFSQISTERTQGRPLNEEQRSLETAIQAEKNTLEQLQKDIQKINQINNAIDESITVLIKEITQARNFERQAWMNFKKIAVELNDKEARDAFYGMATYWQNINDIIEYVQGPFLQHFEMLGKMAQELTEKVKTTLRGLKEKGIDFKKQWQTLEEKQKAAANPVAPQPAQKEVKEEKKPEVGWVGKITQAIGSAVSTVWSYITSGASKVWQMTGGKLFGSKTPVSASESTQDQKVTEEPASAPAASEPPAEQKK